MKDNQKELKQELEQELKQDETSEKYVYMFKQTEGIDDLYSFLPPFTNGSEIVVKESFEKNNFSSNYCEINYRGNINKKEITFNFQVGVLIKKLKYSDLEWLDIGHDEAKLKFDATHLEHLEKNNVDLIETNKSLINKLEAAEFNISEIKKEANGFIDEKESKIKEMGEFIVELESKNKDFNDMLNHSSTKNNSTKNRFNL